MSHKGIRLLIEKISKGLGDDIQFSYGRTSDFNLLKNKRYPFISLSLLTSNASYSVNNVQNYSQNWNVTMAFYEIDKAASTEEEYALILDEMDALADTFIQRLNMFTNEEPAVLLTTINKTPFIKTTADILSGILLSFQIQAPDNWNYCENGC